MRTVLITGSEGLIGSRLKELLEEQGYNVTGIDLKAPTFEGGVQGDILDEAKMRELAQDCVGVVHLAAVSRVIDGQKDPERCKLVNEEGTRRVIEAVKAGKNKPWMIYASSREVYGDSDRLPVQEDFDLQPCNVYAHTKVAGEKLTNALSEQGHATCVLRFANVYGNIERDHRTRVIPAFTRAAAYGEPLNVEGSRNTFDFTHLEDTCDGVARVVNKLDKEGKSLPPIHFLTGVPTTLGQLAKLAVKYGVSGAEMFEAPARNFDVSCFYGTYDRAKTLLGWEPKRTLEPAIEEMIVMWKQAAQTQAGAQ